MKTELLRLKNISKSFHGIRVLNNVDLSVFSGEILGVIGENGAGKSTLIKVLCGFLSADSGKIYKNEEIIKISNPIQAIKQGIHYVMQDFSVFPNITVAENIFLHTSYDKHQFDCDKRKIKYDAKKLLSHFGVDIDINAKVSKLSMSEKYLLEVIIATSTSSDILILDETTATMSRNERSIVHRIMNEHKSKGGAVIFIAQDVDEILKVSDRIQILRDGEVASVIWKKDFDKGKIVKLLTGRSEYISPVRIGKTKGRELLNIEHGYIGEYVKDLNLCLREGEILGITGTVGSGKSHIAKVIFGIEKLTKGSIFIKKKLQIKYSTRKALAAKIAYIPEDRLKSGIFENMSIEENIMIAALKTTLRNIFINNRIRKYLAKYYCEKFNIKAIDTKVRAGELSGGNQQKTIIARWMATKPEIIIADEITNGLDIASKEEVCKTLNSIAETGVGIVLITSNIKDVLSLCDKVIIMRNGYIVSSLEHNEISKERIVSDIWMDE